MYTDEQRRQHICGLQQDLRIIQGSAAGPKISGTYDAPTTEAVKHFQQQNHLPVTGQTDIGTWDMIVQQANAIRSRTAQPLAVRIFPNAAQVVLPGDHGRFLYILQGMFNGLLAQFPACLPLVYTGIYDAATENAVAALQRSAGLPANGRLDASTWNAFAHLYSNDGLQTDNFIDQ